MITPSYSDNLSSRTRLFNFFRCLFRIPILERIIASQTQRSSHSPFWRLAPHEYLYNESSVRKIKKEGIAYELHLCDMLDHAFYYGKTDKAWENFLSLIQANFNVIDVGANVGLVTLPLAARLSSGKVYSYEPSSKNFARLQKNIHLNNFKNVAAQQKGLGSTHQLVKLYEVERHNSGMNRILVNEDEKLKSEHIELSSLDSEINRLGIDPIDVIKIDVEGYEFYVLQGAMKTLQQYKPMLLVEVVDKNLRNHHHRSGDVINFLTDLGYQFFDARTFAQMSVMPKEMETDLLCLHPQSNFWLEALKIVIPQFSYEN